MDADDEVVALMAFYVLLSCEWLMSKKRKARKRGRWIANLNKKRGR